MDDDAFGFEGDDQNPFGEGELDFDNEDFGDFGDDDLDFGNTDFPIDDEEQKVRGKVIFTHYCCSEGDLWCQKFTCHRSNIFRRAKAPLMLQMILAHQQLQMILAYQQLHQLQLQHQLQHQLQLLHLHLHKGLLQRQRQRLNLVQLHSRRWYDMHIG